MAKTAMKQYTDALYALHKAGRKPRNKRATPDLSDSGPYATPTDKETAEEMEISVRQLRKDRWLDDKSDDKCPSKHSTAPRRATTLRTARQ